jgi:hypothetical protein
MERALALTGQDIENLAAYFANLKRGTTALDVTCNLPGNCRAESIRAG